LTGKAGIGVDLPRVRLAHLPTPIEELSRLSEALGGVQSNHCRQTVAAAARVGMSCVLVLNRGYAEEETGNLLLDRLLGAEIVLVDDAEERELGIGFDVVVTGSGSGGTPALFAYQNTFGK